MDVALTLLKLRMPSRGLSARPVRTRGGLGRIPGLPAGREAAGGAGPGWEWTWKGKEEGSGQSEGGWCRGTPPPGPGRA